jgi:hypothetical protein
VLPAIPLWIMVYGRLGFGHARQWLHWIAHHTGAPVVVVAAVALVASWRIAKRALRFAVEVAVVLALLVVATRLGWIRF